MPVTPSGSLSLVLEAARNTLANCTSVQTFLGVGSAAAALARIYYCGLPAPAAADGYTRAELETYRPFIIVSMTNEGGFRGRADSAGSAFGFTHEGQVYAELQDDTDLTLGPGEAELDFTNAIGAVVDSLEGLAGSGGYLAVVDHTSKIWRSPVELLPTQGDYMIAEMTLAWVGG